MVQRIQTDVIRRKRILFCRNCLPEITVVKLVDAVVAPTHDFIFRQHLVPRFHTFFLNLAEIFVAKPDVMDFLGYHAHSFAVSYFPSARAAAAASPPTAATVMPPRCHCQPVRHHMSAIAPGTQPEVYPPRQKNPSLSSACTQPAFSAFFLPDKKLLAKIFFIDYGMRQRRGFPIRRHGFGT